MTTFSVSASLVGFPKAVGLPSSTSLNFTDADLAHALFVTGRAPGDEARHGLASYWEFLHRASLIPAYVRVTTVNRLARSSLALDLDRSEKVNLSYSLGQALAAIFCEQILGVSRLLHVDRYSRQHNVVFGPGRQRPDLFGRGSGGWIVAEAKGRSNAMEPGLAKKLTDQKSVVRSIAGGAPWIAVGSVAEFPPSEGVMRLQAIDPSTMSVEAEDWPVDADRFVFAYYEPFRRLLEAGTLVRTPSAEFDQTGPTVVDFGTAGVRLGLLQAIVDALEALSQGEYEGLAATVDTILAESENTAVRTDGSIFETSWEDSISRQDVEG